MKKTSKKILRIIGGIYLIIFFLLYVLGMGWILFTEGLGEFLDILSPFNFVNHLVGIVLASPGFILYLKGLD